MFPLHWSVALPNELILDHEPGGQESDSGRAMKAEFFGF
jgi:hypothetical protein